MTTKTLMTAEQLLRIPEPEQGGGYELDEGALVYVSPNSFEQSSVILKLRDALEAFVRSRSVGVVAVDTWFEVAPGIVRAPDVAFVPAARWENINPKRALKPLPSLVIEVLSDTSKTAETTRKVQQYLAAGVCEVWVIDAEPRTADLYRPGQLPRKLMMDESLESPDILPGFSLLLSRLFD